MGMRSGFGRRPGVVGMLAACVALSGGSCLWGADENDSARPGAEVTGRVVDEAGKAVAGVRLSGIGYWESGPTTSAEDGTFRLPLNDDKPTERIYAHVYAQAPDGRLGYLLVLQEKPVPVEIVLRPARGLTVRVVDGDGKPVADAEVNVLISTAALFTGTTDADGRATTRVPAALEGRSDWSIFARKSKVGFDYVAGGRDRGRAGKAGDAPLPDALTLTLDGAHTVRVKTVDHAGRPLAGVEVGPWYLQKPGHAAQINTSGMRELYSRTDEDGLASLDWLPAHFERAIPFLARADGHYVLDHATSIKADTPVDELTIAMLPMERFSGRVTFGDGRPAADVVVAVQGRGAGFNPFRGKARTGADGRYSLQVGSEQAYIITASKDDLIAPYKAGVVVRAGMPVEGVDLVLGRGTRVSGRVTVGKQDKPVPGIYVRAVIDKGAIPAELKREGDRVYHALRMDFDHQTDKDGRFAFTLGPGEYTLQGIPRVEPFKIAIPAEDPPAEIVRDFTMPREEVGPFAGTVVDDRGKPVAGAKVEAWYASNQARRINENAVTDEGGTFTFERSLDAMVVHVQAADKRLAGIARVDAEATSARIVVGPLAGATGRLLDLDGKALASRKLQYGIRIYLGDPGRSAFYTQFGGNVETDDDGRFRLSDLVPGETYVVNIKLDEHSSRTATKVTPKGPGAMDLAEVQVDPNPTKPYVPPTPAQHTSEAFAARGGTPAQEKLAYVRTEAKREYTRPLLLFGQPDDPACVDLFRLFNEPTPGDDPKLDKPRPKSPADLRWEFELSSLDATRADVAALARELGLSLEEGKRPLLAVLRDDGTVTATYPLQMVAGKALDARALGAFLLEHKLATRDAERMLNEAFAKAKAEDKRVFLIMSASWCGPCRMLARFLSAQKTELEPHYVFVKLDVSRDQHADSLRERYEKKESNGVPWYIILDADGRPLITSNAEALKAEYGSTNIGFPSSTEGIDHFMTMLQRTAPAMSDATLASLRKALSRRE